MSTKRPLTDSDIETPKQKRLKPTSCCWEELEYREKYTNHLLKHYSPGKECPYNQDCIAPSCHVCGGGTESVCIYCHSDMSMELEPCICNVHEGECCEE